MSQPDHATIFMRGEKTNQREEEDKRERSRLTARLSLEPYNTISELQRRHRAGTGRALPAWKVLDTAVKAYAEQEGIRTEA